MDVSAKESSPLSPLGAKEALIRSDELDVIMLSQLFKRWLQPDKGERWVLDYERHAAAKEESAEVGTAAGCQVAYLDALQPSSFKPWHPQRVFRRAERTKLRDLLDTRV